MSFDRRRVGAQSENRDTSGSPAIGKKTLTEQLPWLPAASVTDPVTIAMDSGGHSDTTTAQQTVSVRTRIKILRAEADAHRVAAAKLKEIAAELKKRADAAAAAQDNAAKHLLESDAKYVLENATDENAEASEAENTIKELEAQEVIDKKLGNKESHSGKLEESPDLQKLKEQIWERRLWKAQRLLQPK